jgi:hypothetical protein
VNCVPALHSVSVPSPLQVFDVTLLPQAIVPEHAGKQVASEGGGLEAVRSEQLAPSIVLWHELLRTMAEYAAWQFEGSMLHPESFEQIWLAKELPEPPPLLHAARTKNDAKTPRPIGST